MLPAALQFLITMIACAINERMQRKLDYTQEEVRVLKEILAALTDEEVLWMLSMSISLAHSLS